MNLFFKTRFLPMGIQFPFLFSCTIKVNDSDPIPFRSKLHRETFQSQLASMPGSGLEDIFLKLTGTGDIMAVVEELVK